MQSLGGIKEKEYLLENLVVLTGSGLDLVSSLDTLLADINSRALRNTLLTLRDALSRGESLHQALERTRMFKPYVLSLISLGEQSGNLHHHLEVIVAQQKKDRLFQSKLRSALAYPLFILGIAALVSTAVTWFILPNLAGIFSQLNLDLPPITRALIGFGLFLKTYGSIAVPLFFLGSVAVIFFMFFFGPTQFIGQTFLLSSPGVGTLIRNIELARAGSLVGTLLEAGVPLVDTLRSLITTTSFSAHRAFYTSLCTLINQGNSFKKTFGLANHSAFFIPTPMQQMIIAGEQSGRLAETFSRIGLVFEEKTDEGSKNLSVILEPVLLIIVWLVVLSIALAVILPIYSLIGQLNR